MANLPNNEIKGRYSNGNAVEEAARVTRSGKSGIYTAVQTTIATASVDTALTALTSGSTMFTGLDGSVANFIDFFSDQALLLRVRTKQNAAVVTASLPSIKIRANSLRTISWLADITEIYVSNASGSTANIDVTLI